MHVGEHGWGTALITDSTYGYDASRYPRPDGGSTTTLRLTLLRAPDSPDPRADLGRHRFGYAVVPGADTRAALAEAHAVNLPLRPAPAGDGRPLVTTRPVRAPHCSISDAALLGGGSPIRPGEVTLAHRGVLFMDELPEFRRNALEPLRQPLEERRITVARGTGAVAFPAAFQLVAAMNPCVCGWLGDASDQCRCTPPLIDRYRARVSGPLLDRIDLHVEVPRVAVASLADDSPGGEPSATIRASCAWRGRSPIWRARTRSPPRTSPRRSSIGASIGVPARDTTPIPGGRPPPTSRGLARAGNDRDRTVR